MTSLLICTVINPISFGLKFDLPLSPLSLCAIASIDEVEIQWKSQFHRWRSYMLDWKNQFNGLCLCQKAIVWRPLMSDHISPKAAHAVHVTTSESQSPYIWTEESFCAFYIFTTWCLFASSGPCLEENCYFGYSKKGPYWNTSLSLSETRKV